MGGQMFWGGSRAAKPAASPAPSPNQPVAPDMSSPCEPEQPAYTVVSWGTGAGTQAPDDDVKFQVEGDAILFVAPNSGTSYPSTTGVRFLEGDYASIPVTHGLLLKFCKPFKEFWIRYTALGFGQLQTAIVFRPGVLESMSLFKGSNVINGIPEL